MRNERISKHVRAVARIIERWIIAKQWPAGGYLAYYNISLIYCNKSANYTSRLGIIL